jgi:hypothetical protein
MKVTKVHSPKAAAVERKRKTPAPGGVKFSSYLDRPADGVGETLPPAAGAAISPVQSILAAQEATDHDDANARRQLYRRGDDILERLDEIRRDILAGAVSRARLENLSQMLRTRRATIADPKLLEIIREIELRAEVEIAKLTRDA